MVPETTVNHATPVSTGPQARLTVNLIRAATGLAAETDADAAEWEDIRVRATPAAVGRDAADAITNLAIACQRRSELRRGGSWRALFPDARNRDQAAGMAQADAAHCYFTVAGILSNMAAWVRAA